VVSMPLWITTIECMDLFAFHGQVPQLLSAGHENESAVHVLEGK
jgi:hypothetical protein